MAVVPLYCTVVPTLTLAPVVVNVAISAVASVPNGMVTATDLPVSLIVPVTPAREKAVMALEENFHALPPPPQEARPKANTSVSH